MELKFNESDINNLAEQIKKETEKMYCLPTNTGIYFLENHLIFKIKSS